MIVRLGPCLVDIRHGSQKGYYVNLRVSAIKRDGIAWAGLDEETPGTGKRRATGLMAGGVPLNVVSSWLGHANVQVTLRIYLPIVGSDYGMENVP